MIDGNNELNGVGGVNEVIEFKDPRRNLFAGIEVDALTRTEKETLMGLAQEVYKGNYALGNCVDNVLDLKNYLKLKLRDYDNEVFGVVWLNSKFQVIAEDELFYGSVSSCSVYPRVVVSRALSHNAVSCALYHNHPSGHIMPSQSDKDITHDLKKALKLVEVDVIDHFIVGDSVLSFAQQGLI